MLEPFQKRTHQPTYKACSFFLFKKLGEIEVIVNFSETDKSGIGAEMLRPYSIAQKTLAVHTARAIYTCNILMERNDHEKGRALKLTNARLLKLVTSRYFDLKPCHPFDEHRTPQRQKLSEEYIVKATAHQVQQLLNVPWRKMVSIANER